jgi:hypothetical protein
LSQLRDRALNADHAEALRSILLADSVRWRALVSVMALGLPDCWIGAGFVRNAVWDHLHGLAATVPSGDVDVVWFDPQRADPGEDAAVEARLRALDPGLDWSVRNQARMHERNGDAAYASCVDAMRHWPETATAVAVRRTGEAACDIAAPFGLDDLFGLVVRPTPGIMRQVYLDRVAKKRWAERWPRLRIFRSEGKQPN